MFQAQGVEALHSACDVGRRQHGGTRLDLHVDTAVRQDDFDVFVSLHDYRIRARKLRQQETGCGVEMLIQIPTVNTLDTDELMGIKEWWRRDVQVDQVTFLRV